ncbi:hypothetical protein [Dapis sp. BLCC M229]|uniref:hypothetical protein n=1 Tax=Dapis sp. BLCC M229 TaxID=3400188 RepID=UPI003CF2494D
MPIFDIVLGWVEVRNPTSPKLQGWFDEDNLKAKVNSGCVGLSDSVTQPTVEYHSHSIVPGGLEVIS